MTKNKNLNRTVDAPHFTKNNSNSNLYLNQNESKFMKLQKSYSKKPEIKRINISNVPHKRLNSRDQRLNDFQQRR